MKRLGIMAGVCLLMLGMMIIPVSAQDSQQEQETQQTEEQSKEEYMTVMEAFWAEMEEDVNMLGQNAQEAGSDVETKYNQFAVEFKQGLKSAREEMAKLDEAEIWQDLQAGTEQATENVKQTYYKLKSSMVNSKEDYQAYLDLRLKDLGQKIETLQRDMKQAGEEAQAEMQDAMDSLQQEQSTLQSEFKKLKEATQESWQDLKKNKIEPALQEVEKAYGEAKAKLNDMLSQ